MVVLSMDNTQIYPASCPYICEIQLSLRTYFTILRTNYTVLITPGGAWGCYGQWKLRVQAVFPYVY